MPSIRLQKGLGVIAPFFTAAAFALVPATAVAEVNGPCSQAVGTFLTENELDYGGRSATSRSLLILTNGGHALRFDSDEDGAAMDYRPFGDSAGTWRCDGMDDDGTIRLTATMLDFTYPDAEGADGQIARIDVSGRYAPKTETMELTGKLGFLPMTAEAQKPDALAEAASTLEITLRGARIELPAPR